jgi:hypothetical protein
MNRNTTQTPNSLRLKRDLDREAVDLALKGEWERATEVNRAVLELFTDDVEAMNRLAKALMELGDYGEAGKVLDSVSAVAPYNKIAKKNRARLDQLSSNPSGSRRHSPRAAGKPQLFIEESGKSTTTILRRPTSRPVAAGVSPGEPVDLVQENNTLNAYSGDGDFLGQLEPKLGKRLAGLMKGGNTYAAAVIGVNPRGVSVIIRETFRHRSLHNVCSFPNSAKDDALVHLNEKVARLFRNDDRRRDQDDGQGAGSDEDDKEEDVIDEEAMEGDWTENE